MGKWLDRSLVSCPYYINLCLSEKDYQRELRRIKLERKDWPPFLMSPDCDATAQFLEASDGKKYAIVCLGPTEKMTDVQVLGILVHEATHVWQYSMKVLEEDRPSDEFMAYGVQSIAQVLIESYFEQTKGLSLEVAIA